MKNEVPLRKNELAIISLLSEMIIDYKETETLDDVSELISKTSDEILDMYEMKIEEKIDQLQIEVINLKNQLSALSGYVYSQNFCKCPDNIFTSNGTCMGCGKPLMPSAAAQTGT